jgi:hypothetical protein
LSGSIGTRRMGPVSTIICELSNRFVRRGHEVVVVDVPAKDARARLDARVRVVEVDGKPRSLVNKHERNRAIRQVAAWGNYYRCLRGLSTRHRSQSSAPRRSQSPSCARRRGSFAARLAKGYRRTTGSYTFRQAITVPWRRDTDKPVCYRSIADAARAAAASRKRHALSHDRDVGDRLHSGTDQPVASASAGRARSSAGNGPAAIRAVS